MATKRQRDYLSYRPDLIKKKKKMNGNDEIQMIKRRTNESRNVNDIVHIYTDDFVVLVVKNIPISGF